MFRDIVKYYFSSIHELGLFALVEIVLEVQQDTVITVIQNVLETNLWCIDMNWTKHTISMLFLDVGAVATAVTELFMKLMNIMKFMKFK